MSSEHEHPATPTTTSSLAAHEAWILAARKEAASRWHPGGGSPAPPAALGGMLGNLAEALPGYELRQEVYRGGQAVVIRGVQRSTGRDVAIKVLRGGDLAAPQHHERFRREVRILARLKHPNIVTILDSGAAAGQFYYIMDHIPGHALDEHTLGKVEIADVVGVFIKVCDAVNVAHLRGIIHRDLKPGNIRVDPAGEPHVLDFGLAKLKEPDLDAESPAGHHTMTGQFVGSPPWASPEQVEGDPASIDARSDVYSLGVMLYQALTGEFPYRVDGPLSQVLHNICHVDPPRPSAINPRVGEELDAIVLTCLRKSPGQRYQTAGELGRDLQRYVSGLPIEAKRDQSWYVFRKAVRRHRMTAALVGLAAALVVTVSVGLAVMYRREARLREVAESAGREAARQASIAQAVNDFLNNDLLQAVKPERSGRDATIREVVDAASARVEGRFTDQPLVEAAIRQTLGDAYMELGEWTQALVHAERCLALRRSAAGEEARETLSAMNLVGRLYRRLGRFEEAHAVYTAMLASAERVLGNEDEVTLRGMNNHAYVLQQLGRIRDAYNLNRRVLEARMRALGPEHEETLTSMNNDAFYTQALGRIEEAAGRYAHVLELRRRVLGPEHPDTLMSMHNVASMWKRLGRLDEAERLHQERLALVLRVQGWKHDDALHSYSDLGDLYRQQGCYEDAEQAFLESLDIQLALTGEMHPGTAQRLRELGQLYRDLQRIEEAEDAFLSGLAILRATVDDTHVNTHALKGTIGSFYLDLGRLDEAESFLLEAYPGICQVYSPSHERSRAVAERLAVLYERLGDARTSAEWRRLATPENPGLPIGG